MTFKEIVIGIAAFAVGYILGFIMDNKNKDYQEPIIKTETVYVTDTITDIQYKTKYRLKFDTINYTDTLVCKDTIQVPIPISKYVFDTIMPDTTHFKAVLSGFNVKVDSLLVEHKESVLNGVFYEPKKKWRFSYGLVIGVGIAKPM